MKSSNDEKAGEKEKAFFGGGATRAERALELAALLVAIAFSLSIAQQGLFEKAGYFIPTYDNAMLWGGRTRFVMDYGHYIDRELVFAGLTQTYHVPAYPALVASFAELAGVNWLWGMRLIALVFAVLLPLAFYCLARRASGGNAFAGAAAAFFAVMMPSLIDWGMRTTPISLGVITIVAVLWLVLERNWVLVALGAAMLAMLHQPSLLVLVGTLGVYFIARNGGAAWSFFKRSSSWSKNEVFLLADSFDWLPFVGAAAALVPYLAWHVSKTGLGCLTLKCLPQGAAHEFGEPVKLASYFASNLSEHVSACKQSASKALDSCASVLTGFAPKFPAFFALLGVAWLAFDKRASGEAKLLLFSWLLTCVILVKNDLLGIAVFTQRFVTFFDEAVAVFAGLFVGGILVFACSVLEKRFASLN